jgi:hypothetical protein
MPLMGSVALAGSLTLIATAAALHAACGASGRAPAAVDSEAAPAGRVEGTVSFVGSDCNPAVAGFSVPPCSGPYPGYALAILDASGTSVVTRVTTDAEGRYAAAVPPGRYLVRVPGGEAEQRITFTVSVGVDTNVDVSIDTGIR